MVSGPRRILAIVLLMAAALPSPRVANLLIAEAPGHAPGESRKPPQARGRNRIGSPIQLQACPSLAPKDGGRARPKPPGRIVALDRPASSPSARTLRPASPALAPLHLRC